MKKLLIGISAFAIILTSSCGLAEVSKENERDNTSMFVLIEKAELWDVVYQKETKVMYVVSYGLYNNGTFTLLVNADGTPMVYGG